MAKSLNINNNEISLIKIIYHFFPPIIIFQIMYILTILSKHHTILLFIIGTCTIDIMN